MKTIQNKISIIIPAFKGLRFLERNQVFWNELTTLIGASNIHLIEDDLSAEMQNYSEKMLWKYYKKENGNWGSVINYAVSNITFTTKYVFILDVDDIMEMSELGKLLIHMENVDSDIIQTKTQWQYWDSPKPFKVNDHFWVHSIFIKTEIFKKIPKLPEGVFFMDNYLIAAIERYSQDINMIDVAPYIYFLNVEGQSVSSKKFTQLQAESHMELLQGFPDWIKKNNFQNGPKFKSHAVASLPGSAFFGVRNFYDKAQTRQERKQIAIFWKKMKKVRKPTLQQSLFWSKLYVFFTFKFLR